MLGKDELEARLIAWAEEYGGGRYENIGFSSRNLLETLGKHGGFVPDSGGFSRPVIRTAADEVERAVKAMIASPLYRCAFVMKCEYFRPDIAMDDRRKWLRSIGISISEDGYSDALEAGRAHLARVLAARVNLRVSLTVPEDFEDRLHRSAPKVAAS